MKKIATLLAFILAFVLLYESSYTLLESQQAIILELGKIKGVGVSEAGVHFKLPWIQEVKYFDKRILQWDGDRGEIPTKDKKFIWVDTAAHWRISDPVMFYKVVKDTTQATLRMGPVLEGITKDTISNFNLIEAVRNSNQILDEINKSREAGEKLLAADSSDTTLDELSSGVEKISTGREKLSQLISERARGELRQFGIELIDVQIRSIAYKEVVEQKVYNRMISERMKIATKIRSTGKGEEARILGQLDLTLKKIESEAYRSAQILKGDADAKAIRIFAAALKDDPQYFEFVKTLDTYKKTLAKKGTLLLSTDNAFLRLLSKGSL
jgi:membrane protease subunit HflC